LAKRTLLVALVVAAASVSVACTGDPAQQPQPQRANDSLQYGSRYQLPPEYADLQSAYQRWLDDIASTSIADGMVWPPPDAAFKRFVKPDEAAGAMIDCLLERGINVSGGPDGEIRFAEYPAEQSPAVLAAQFNCQVEFPLDPKYTAKLTRVQIESFYRYYVDQLVPCLAAEGFQTDARTVPTLPTFVESFGTANAWSPYRVVINRERELAAQGGGVLPAGWEETWQRVNEACPQSPPLSVLYP
jgi:hypothetical protein